jgi:transposase
MNDYFICIDVGKNHHWANVMTPSGEIIVNPFQFSNDIKGFKVLLKTIQPYLRKDHLVGMEDTGHYGDNLRVYLLDHKATVAMINPVSTDAMRKATLKSTKTDKEDTKYIGIVLLNPMLYRIVDKNSLDTHEMRELTRYHHNMQEACTRYKAQLQKDIDKVFPEYNSLFSGHHGPTYMRILEQFQSADTISHTDIRTLRSAITPKGQRGRSVSFTAEQLKQLARNSVGEPNMSIELEIKHLVGLINLINKDLDEVDKKIREYSSQLNSPIKTIPGVGDFSCVSICSEIGRIDKFDNPYQLISYSGTNPIVYQSGQYQVMATRISKRGSKYLRKTLYQIIQPVIENNAVFKVYYLKKISEGKTHRCAQGHCVRKLLRVIFHLLKTGESFDPNMIH